MKNQTLFFALFAMPSAIASTAGQMTMWSSASDVIVGGSCEYANSAQGGLASAAAQSPYITSNHYCAVDANLYDGGLACGRCYRITFEGEDTTETTGCAAAGSAIIQVVDSGSGEEFDCQETVFKEISGCGTGVMGIKYEEVECEGNGPATATIVAQNGDDAHVVFSGLQRPVASASVSVSGEQENTFVMSLVQGAWDVGTPDVKDVPVTFKLTLDNGDLVELTECFSDWPQPVGASCSAGTTIANPSGSTTTTVGGSATTTASGSPTTASSGCAAVWQQCAGNEMAATCCEQGSQCVFVSEWYSQCQPSSSDDSNPTPTPAPVTTTPAPATTAASGCAAVWEQCGGNGMASTCCEEGSQCVFSSEWYSQCRPMRRNLRGLLRGK